MKFDIIGDIHGCFDELIELIETLGYEKHEDVFIHPEGRNLAFVGDATDRGPKSIPVMRLMFALQDKGLLYYSPGNHCNKLYRFFKGNKVHLTHGIETTISELHKLPRDEQQKFRNRFIHFYEELPYYQELGEDLIVAHAGLKAEMIGKPIQKKIAVFVFYGDITGNFHADGRPIRRDWAKHYDGEKWIVYGHTPTWTPYVINQTVNIDTGCVFGGALSAFRFPEKEVVSVPSRQAYYPDRFHRYY